MSSINIRQFNPAQSSELAKNQTRIYNQAISKFPAYLPTNVDDVLTFLHGKGFEYNRMFYAYDGPKMIGFSTLSYRDIKNNLRIVSYPWILKDTPPSVRDLLFNAMERHCRREGTRMLRSFVLESYPDMVDFFKSKKFSITQEFIIMEKPLTKNTFYIPLGFKLRPMTNKDIDRLEAISLHDPRVKTRFTPSDQNQFRSLSEFNPADVIVAEKDGRPVGFYALTIPSDPSKTKAYITAEAVDIREQVIEPYLVMGLENRALERGMKTIVTSFKAGSKRIHLASERGFQKVGITFRLDKNLY